MNQVGLIIDNFAGGGGASTGIEAALGRPVDIAINHSAAALACHAANHPGTLHVCEDVFAVSPREVCNGRPVDLAWFSPDCKHFSKAKGGRPVDKRIRGLAWVAVRWARAVQPRVIVLENVEEFETWGPLLDDGRPNPEKRGLTFKRFVGCLRSAGYTVDWRCLVAADYGAPTTRRRLFLIARCDGAPICWPEPARPWRSAAECIDWSLTCQPIFGRTRPLAENTKRRIAEGRIALGEDRFLISYYGNGSAYSLARPLPTITTRDRFALIDGEQMRMLQPRELATAQGFPRSYSLPDSKSLAVRLIGNSVCPPVAEAIVRANLPEQASQAEEVA